MKQFKREYVLHPKNMPPNMSWVWTVWLLLLTVKAYELGLAGYIMVAGYTIIILTGWLRNLSRLTVVDVFESLTAETEEKADIDDKVTDEQTS